MLQTITLRAHIDGERINLDDPYRLETGTQLIITVLPRSMPESDDDLWRQFSHRGLEMAYGENEPEYSSTMIREPNPEYEA